MFGGIRVLNSLQKWLSWGTPDVMLTVREITLQQLSHSVFGLSNKRRATESTAH